MNAQTHDATVQANGQEMLPPSGLLCDLLAAPQKTEITTRTPTFGWIVNGGAPGPAQSAYQIRVMRAGDEESPGLAACLWDSGRVASSESINIAYKGEPLYWGKPYVWQVRSWTAEAGPSPWSESQNFGLAHADSGDGVSCYRLETAQLQAASVSHPSPQTTLFDFGRHAFGWLEIEIELRAPLQITVRVGERECAGHLDRHPPGCVRYCETVTVLAPGKARHRVPFPPDLRNTEAPGAIRLPVEFGVVLPFRYAEVDNLPAGALVEMVRLQYPFDENAAAFHSSNPHLDDVFALCHDTILATSFAGYYIDGDRERIPYEADAYINQLSHYAVDREFSLARRTHHHLLRNPTWPTEWKQHSILIAWADFEATGDWRSLEQNYEILKKEKLLLGLARADGLLDTSGWRDIVDWPECERDGFEFTSVNAVVNAFHFQTLVLMSRIANFLDRRGDAADFAEKAARFPEAFQAAFFDPARGHFLDGPGSHHASLHANLFPLAFGLIPARHQASVLAFIKSRGMACSVYAAQFLLEGLFLAGEDSYAIALMTSNERRSWRNMRREGATITWEAWDVSFKPNLDWNHAWGAAPANIISRYVLGVRAAEPGYGRVVIRPQLGDLDWVEGVVPTIRGSIHVRAWRDAATGRIEKKVQIPANMHLEEL